MGELGNAVMNGLEGGMHSARAGKKSGKGIGFGDQDLLE